VVLVCHVISLSKMPWYDDRQFLQEVYDAIADKFKRRIGVVAEDIGSRKIKYFISQLDYFAGARMHSTIAAFSTNVPTISLAYSRKGEALNRLIFGHDDWVIKIAEFTAESFCEKLNCLIDQKGQVRSVLEEKIPQLKQHSLNAGKYLRDMLNK